jgi:hypothetical protein
LRVKSITSVEDPDPVIFAFLTPGSGIWDGKKSGSVFRIRDEPPRSFFREFLELVKILKLSCADPDPGSMIQNLFDCGSEIKD